MKKILSLALAVLMLFTLAACGEEKPEGTTAPQETNAPIETTAPVETAAPVVENENAVITVSEFFADDSKWEDDGGYHERTADKLFFDNYMAGDYAAIRLTETAQNVTYKFKLTVSKLAPVSMEDWTWWDSELLIIARSSIAAASWYDDGSQTGYTLTSWGDMSSVFIGRCGYDDAFGEFQWNVNDGQPHDIELSVVNNEDNTQVTITLIVDGVEIASVVDDGTKIKNERPGLYPDAGGLTIRCKWLEATIN